MINDFERAKMLKKCSWEAAKKAHRATGWHKQMWGELAEEFQTEYLELKKEINDKAGSSK